MLSEQFKSAFDEFGRGGIFVNTSSWKYPGGRGIMRWRITFILQTQHLRLTTMRAAVG